MSNQSINPISFGFVMRMIDGENEFLYIKEDKVVARMFHVNFWQGIPYEWAIKKVIHCVDGSIKSHTIYEGSIPTEEFGKELIKNLNL